MLQSINIVTIQTYYGSTLTPPTSTEETHFIYILNDNKYKLGSEGENATYNDLNYADITIKDTHFLMYGRSDAIV